MTDEKILAEIERNIQFHEQVWVEWSKRVDGTHVSSMPYPSKEACEVELHRTGRGQQGFMPIEMSELPEHFTREKVAILERERSRETIQYLCALIQKLKKLC